MSKMNKKIVIFIVFIIPVVLAGIFMKMPIDNKIPVDNKTQVGGMDIQFRDGISESEVKSVLENYNMTMNYSLDYNTSNTNEKYYIMVDKDKITDIKSELGKKKNWTEASPALIKGNYYIITAPEQAINDKNFLDILNKHGIQLRKFVWCEMRFGDGSKNWIPEIDAIRIKNELEKDENIFTVHLGYLYYGA
ncbi:MAG TPA: UPF0228 family protein [Methanosarcina sp.]|jgi:hypothetical protein